VYYKKHTTLKLPVKSMLAKYVHEIRSGCWSCLLMLSGSESGLKLTPSFIFTLEQNSWLWRGGTFHWAS